MCTCNAVGKLWTYSANVIYHLWKRVTCGEERLSDGRRKFEQFPETIQNCIEKQVQHKTNKKN